MTGAADWAATIVAGIILLTAVAYVLDWLAEKIIAAIKWMMRFE